MSPSCGVQLEMAPRWHLQWKRLCHQSRHLHPLFLQDHVEQRDRHVRIRSTCGALEDGSPFIRGQSTHPGVVVDLCQNPNDPTRVSVSIPPQAFNGRLLVRALAIHRLQHTSRTHGDDLDWTRDLLEFEAKSLGKCLYDPTCK